MVNIKITIFVNNRDKQNSETLELSKSTTAPNKFFSGLKLTTKEIKLFILFATFGNGIEVIA